MLRGWVDPYAELEERLRTAREMAELLEAEPDDTMREELEREASQVEQALESFELKAMLQGSDDARDAIVTIHPGAGGTESQDWA